MQDKTSLQDEAWAGTEEEELACYVSEVKSDTSVQRQAHRSSVTSIARS